MGDTDHEATDCEGKQSDGAIDHAGARIGAAVQCIRQHGQLEEVQSGHGRPSGTEDSARRRSQPRLRPNRRNKVNPTGRDDRGYIVVLCSPDPLLAVERMKARFHVVPLTWVVI